MKGVSSLSPRGQVTIPKAIREELGLHPYDKVEVLVENGQATLRKVDRSLDDVAGSLPPLGMPVEEAIHRAKNERARRYRQKHG
ncbi:MAG TPA: AbrB/MazE/SpoVT family DNA-binding domain-containing protein [Thermomicrobiales bacterium]|nr:AbrB/MazE/SpoVT family DNA-binding domain-containing protein [Thermomicrobiales bacterium]